MTKKEVRERIGRTLVAGGATLMGVGLPLGNVTIGLLIAALGQTIAFDGRRSFAHLMAWKPLGRRVTLKGLFWAILAAFVVSGVVSPDPLSSIGQGISYVLIVWLAFYVGAAFWHYGKAFAHIARWIVGLASATMVLVALWVGWEFVASSGKKRIAMWLLPVNESGSLWLLALIVATAYFVGMVLVGRRPLGILGAVGVFASLFGVLATMSRGSWVGMGAMGVLYSVRSKKGWIFLLLATVVLAVLVTQSPRLEDRFQSIFDAGRSSNVQRLLAWRVAPKMIADHPFFGVGISEYQEAYREYRLPQARERLYHAHNYLVHLVVVLGFVGGGPLLLLIGLTTWHALRAWWSSSGIARVGGVGWLAFLVREQFDATNLALDVAAGFWLLGAFVLLMASAQTDEDVRVIQEEVR